MNELQKDLGRALVLGGLLLIVLNAVFTPMMPYEASEGELRSSWPYLVRLSLAVLAAISYLLGAVGVRMAHGNRVGGFDRLAFWVAVLGSSLLIGLEWSNVFVLRPLAQVAPDALAALDEVALYGIGFGVGASLYALGWILLAVSVWRSRVAPRWVPLTILAGFVATAVLGATVGVLGMVAGSVVIGVGLVGLGRSVVVSVRSDRHENSATRAMEFVYVLKLNRPEILAEGPTADEAAVLERHAAYVSTLADQGVVEVAGRTQNPDPSTFGLVIFEAESDVAAHSIMDADPAVSEGVMRAELFPYRVAFRRARA